MAAGGGALRQGATAPRGRAGKLVDIRNPRGFIRPQLWVICDGEHAQNPVRPSPSILAGLLPPRRCLLAFAAGIATGYLGAAGPNLPRNAASGFVPLDDLTIKPSFSEIRNLKTALHMRCVDFLLNCRTKGVNTGLPVQSEDPSEWEPAERELLATFEFLLDELSGTPEEIEVRLAILSLYSRHGASSAWLDGYLHLAYLHPAHRFVRNARSAAMRHARLIVRVAELEAALRHLDEIPARYLE